MARASEIIKELQDLVAVHGDLNVWAASDDEGNEYNQLWIPQVGYVPKAGAGDYRQDCIMHSDDLVDAWRDEQPEPDDQEWCDAVPTPEELSKFLGENYVKVIVH